MAQNSVCDANLIWQDNCDAGVFKLDWQGAKKYCENLELNSHNDWRLPSVKELSSLTDITKINPAINSKFKNIKNDFYWSSTPYASNVSGAWVVNFAHGYTFWDLKTKENFVRCVRSGK